MLLRHANPGTEAVGLHSGETYTRGGDGLFDVADEHGQWLLDHQPGWRLYTGTDESEADRAAAAEAENRELRRRIAELEAAAPADPANPGEPSAAADPPGKKAGEK